ncbi:hypothetical protein AO902_29415 [Pseudomonas aeruginosa]|nr:hypothetical protein AO902_29415 [Pseudomonas aeruginosa]
MLRWRTGGARGRVSPVDGGALREECGMTRRRLGKSGPLPWMHRSLFLLLWGVGGCTAGLRTRAAFLEAPARGVQRIYVGAGDRKS